MDKFLSYLVWLHNFVDKRYSQKKLTKQKRKSQTCRVFEVKIDRSHLSDAALGHNGGVKPHHLLMFALWALRPSRRRGNNAN